MARLGPARAVGTYNTHSFPGGIHFDATTMALGTRITEPERFSHAVILLSDTNPDRCARHPEVAHLLNVESICRVIDQLDIWGVIPRLENPDSLADPGLRG